VPSPIGHALGALAAGWTVAPRPDTTRQAWTQAAIIAATGAAADLDLLIGRHRAETHSIGAAVIVATLAAVWRWPVARSRARIWLVIALAWCTHPLLDALGTDTAPPIGIMAWWPFSHAYVLAGWHLFAGVTRRWQDPVYFIRLNAQAAVREVAILMPLAVLAWWWRLRRPAVTARR
jgi:LexA-binding, inner membrane-associated putative hydrolase